MAQRYNQYESSFLNERSAELFLVPRLVKLLENEDVIVTPIFYWATREGGSMAKASFLGIRMKLLVFYARRPKIASVGEGIISIKINELILNRSRQYAEYGIPTVAGFPLVDSLSEFHSTSPAAWIKIDPNFSEHSFQINLNSMATDSAMSLLSDEDIQNVVFNQCQTFEWNELIVIFKKIRTESLFHGLGHHFLFGDKYKPIYLLIHQKLMR